MSDRETPSTNEPDGTTPSWGVPTPIEETTEATGQRNDGPSSDVSDDVARLTESELNQSERRRLLARVASTAAKGARTGADGARSGARLMLLGPKAAVRWTLDTIIETAPRLPIRDAETIRRHYKGLYGDELAKAMVRNASRVTAAIGVAGGGLAALQWGSPPTLLTAPVLIAAETAAVVAVEIKLIAELHEVFGTPVQGTVGEKGGQLLTAWAHRRGVSILHPARGLASVVSTGLRTELRDQLLRRMGKNFTTIGPFLTGAAVAAELNRRATKSLGEKVWQDLRAQVANRSQLPPSR